MSRRHTTDEARRNAKERWDATKSKEAKRAAHEVRAAICAETKPSTRLQRLKRRPGESKRERARLSSIVDTAKNETADKKGS